MIEIKLKPMSLGRAWSQSKSGKRFLVTEARQYKALVAFHCREMAFLSGHRGAIRFTIEYHGPWLTKQGGISKTAGDIDNFSKLLVDSLCEHYDFDDSQIMEMNLKKVIADQWKIRLQAETISLESFFANPASEAKSQP